MHTDGFSRREVLYMVALCAVVLAVFGNTLSFGFVWDDKDLVLAIDAYRDFDPRSIFLSPANGLEYLPVRDLSFALDFALWGEWASGFHLSNLLIYGATVQVVYLFTFRLLTVVLPGSVTGNGKGRKGAAVAAFAAALLFAVHPLHSEVVSFVTQRNKLLSGLFFFLACLCYVIYLERAGGKGRAPLAASFGCFVLAVFSAQSAIVLPLVLLAMAVARGGRTSARLPAMAPFFGLSAAAFFLFRWIAHSAYVVIEDQVIFGKLTLAPRAAAALQIPHFYLARLLFPTELSAEYAVAFTEILWRPPVLLGAAGLAGAAFIAFRVRRNHPFVPFCLAWFLLCLIPFLNFLLTTPVVADRYAYLPSFGLALLVAVLLHRLSADGFGVPALVSAAVLLVSLSALTVQANNVWRSDESLFLNIVKHDPGSIKGHWNLGVLYYAKKDYARAFNHLEEIARIDPAHAAYDFYRGKHLYERGDLQGALRHLTRATAVGRRMHFQNAESYIMLGVVHEKLGNIDEAVTAFRTAARSRHAGLAGLAEKHLRTLQEEQAPLVASLRDQVRQSPDNPNARARLALALDRLGQYEEALGVYHEMEKSGRASWELFFNMAGIYKKTGRPEQAVTYYERSIALNPANARAHNGLGQALKSLGRHRQAVAAFREAMEADPSYEHAPYNLAVLHYEMGQPDEARRYFLLVLDRFPHMAGMVKPYLDRTNRLLAGSP